MYSSHRHPNRPPQPPQQQSQLYKAFLYDRNKWIDAMGSKKNKDVITAFHLSLMIR